MASAFVADAEFKKEVDKLDKLVPKPKEPVCQDVSGKVAKCYSENAKQPLRCSDVVKEFAICVENHTVVSSLEIQSNFFKTTYFIYECNCTIFIFVQQKGPVSMSA